MIPWLKDFPKRPLYLRILLLLLIYVFLDRVLMRTTVLPASSYYEPFILEAFFKTALTNKLNLLLLPIVACLIFFRKRTWTPWQDFPKGKYLRFLLTLTTAILAWKFSTYDYNLFFDQTHYYDRFLLLAFIPLVYWRPVFVFPFLLVLLPIIGQFTKLPGFSWGAYFLPVRILILWLGTYLIYLATRHFLLRDFAFFLGLPFFGTLRRFRFWEIKS